MKYAHPYLAATQLHGIGEQLVPLAAGVATIGGVKTVFVIRAHDATLGIQPAITQWRTRMGAGARECE